MYDAICNKIMSRLRTGGHGYDIVSVLDVLVDGARQTAECGDSMSFRFCEQRLDGFLACLWAQGVIELEDRWRLADELRALIDEREAQP